MNMMKNMAVFGLSICFLAMSLPVMAADEEKYEKMPAQLREESKPMKNMLATLVVNGTISEETYAAIEEYFNENKPDQSLGAEFDGERPERPDNVEFDGIEPPEIPDNGEFDGTEPPERPVNREFVGHKPHRMPAPILNSDILQNILDAGIITDEEYEAINDSLPIMPLLSSENE